MTAYTRIYANSAKTLASSPINAGDNFIQVSDATRFPTPAANQFFSITLDNGTSFEICNVFGKSGNVLTNVVRGVEGTIAKNFLVGTRVENRVTADTLGSFARLIDRVADITSVDNLDTVANSPANSYLCASDDDSGNPIVAVKNGLMWRFVNHPTVILSTAAEGTGTTTQVPLTGANLKVPVVQAGSHIIQFTSGSNAGSCRIIQSSTDALITWTTPLANNVVAGDQYEVYESSAFSLNTVKVTGDDALIFSIIFGD